VVAPKARNGVRPVPACGRDPLSLQPIALGRGLINTQP